jgi:hypothetical protein
MSDAPVTFYTKTIEAGQAGFSVLVAQLVIEAELGAAHAHRTGLYDATTEANVKALYLAHKHDETDTIWDSWAWETFAPIVMQHKPWIAMTAHQHAIDRCVGVGPKAAQVAMTIYANYRMNVHYAEVRPEPVCIVEAAAEIIETDCSGFADDCHKLAGGQDPSGTNYDGQGYTGDEWANGTAVSLGSLALGDLVFYNNGSSGYQPGHVAIYVGKGMVVSNGRYPCDYLPTALPGLSIMGARRYG